MKKILAVVLTTALVAAPVQAGLWDNFMKWANPKSVVPVVPVKKVCRCKAFLCNKKTAAVLLIGTAAAVGGYFLYKKYFAQPETELE